MSPTQTPRRPSGQPVTRRSARQDRIARRHPERDLSRASTKGKAGGPSPIVVGTVVAVIAGAVLIAYAIISRGGVGPQVTTIQTPIFVTSASIPHDDAKLQLGDPAAKVKVDLWEDYRCSYCGNFSRSMEPNLIKDFVQPGKAYVQYHDWTVIDQGDGATASRDAANAARCAADQNKFWQFHDWLFFNQSGDESAAQFSIDRLVEFGQKFSAAEGLDTAKFDQCVRGGTHNSEVDASTASRPKDASGTPAIYVNGSLTPVGTYDDLKNAINKAINATPAPSTSPVPSSSTSPAPSSSASASVAPTSSLLFFGLPLTRRLRRRLA